MKTPLIAIMASMTFAACPRGASPSHADEASHDEVSSAEAPATPISHVTNPPPPVGSRLELSDEEWRARLTPDQYEVLRTQRTEPAFSCPLWSEHRAGTFYCGGCGAPLFSSRDKFDSGTGWTSFVRPIESGRVAEDRDDSHAMVRTEVHCARCDGHLGHVFEDGPAPTGQRYCINGVALEFVPDENAPRAD